MKPSGQKKPGGSPLGSQGPIYGNPSTPSFAAHQTGAEPAEANDRSAGMKRQINSCPDFTQVMPGKTPFIPLVGAPGYPQGRPLLAGDMSPLLSSYVSAQAATRGPQMMSFAAHPMLKVAEAFALVAAGQAAAMNPNPYGMNPAPRNASVPIAPSDGAVQDGVSKKLTKTRGGDVANSKTPMRPSGKQGEPDSREGDGFQGSMGYNVPFAVGSGANEMARAGRSETALDRMNQIKTIMSCPDMVTYYERIQLEDSRRKKKLERNRASARLRRLRKKNLVAAHEEDTARLEKAVELLKEHKWGSERSDCKSLVDALREGKRKTDYLNASGRCLLLGRRVQDQLERLRVVKEGADQIRLLQAVAGQGVSDPAMEEFASELQGVLNLDDRQKARIQATCALRPSSPRVKEEEVEGAQTARSVSEESPYHAIHDLVGLNERRRSVVACSVQQRIALLQKMIHVLARTRHIELRDFSRFVEKMEDVLNSTQIQKTVQFAQRNHDAVTALYRALCQAHTELGISNLKDEEAKLEEEIQIKCDEALREFDAQQIPATLGEASKGASVSIQQIGDVTGTSDGSKMGEERNGTLHDGSTMHKSEVIDGGAKLATSFSAAVFESGPVLGDLSARNEKILQFRRDAVYSSTRGAVIASRIEDKVLRALEIAKTYSQPIRFTFDAPAAALSQVLSKTESTGSLDGRSPSAAAEAGPNHAVKVEQMSMVETAPDSGKATHRVDKETPLLPSSSVPQATPKVPLPEPVMPQATPMANSIGATNNAKLRSKSTPNLGWKVEEPVAGDIAAEDDSMELEMLGLDLDIDVDNGDTGDFYRSEWLPWIEESPDTF